MAYVGDNWENVDPTNKLPFSYDFRDRISSDDSIVSVSWGLAVVPTKLYAATDDAADSHLITSSFGRTVATAWLDGLVTNCRYRLTASIVTANGIHDDLWAYIQCDASPAG